MITSITLWPMQENLPPEESDLAQMVRSELSSLKNHCPECVGIPEEQWLPLLRPLLQAPIEKENLRERRSQPMLCLILALCQKTSVLLKQVIPWLGDEEAQIRLAAVQALGLTHGHSERLLPLLLSRLHDEDLTVRHAAGRALGAQGDRATIIACLQSHDMQTRIGGYNALALLSLLDYRDPMLVEYYPRILADWRLAEKREQQEIALAIRHMRVPVTCLPELQRAFSSSDPAERRLAVCGFKELYWVLDVLEEHRNSFSVEALSGNLFWVNVSYTADYWREYERKVHKLREEPAHKRVFALLCQAILDPDDRISSEAYWRAGNAHQFYFTPLVQTQYWRTLQETCQKSPNRQIRIDAVQELNHDLEEHPELVAPLLAAYLCDADLDVATRVDLELLADPKPIQSALMRGLTDSRLEIRKQIHEEIENRNWTKRLDSGLRALLSHANPVYRWRPAAMLLESGSDSAALCRELGRALSALDQAEREVCLIAIDSQLDKGRKGDYFALAGQLTFLSASLQDKLCELLLDSRERGLGDSDLIRLRLRILCEIRPSAECLDDIRGIFDWPRDRSTLLKWMRHKEPYVRAFAVTTLKDLSWKFSADDRQAVKQALEALKKDPDPAVRHALDAALAELAD